MGKIIQQFFKFIIFRALGLFVAGYFVRDCLDEEKPKVIEKHSHLRTE